ncbi:hypothetical protein EDF56_106360 [Novosphingobium sp. PhB165]|nr:hypothetical protein EDF56_106360 [Novosphingobium sp. PhB165]
MTRNFTTPAHPERRLGPPAARHPIRNSAVSGRAGGRAGTPPNSRLPIGFIPEEELPY